jgi:hypothetical protein
MTEERDQPTKKWIEEAEEALNRVGDSLRAAWEETQDARMATLESAKEATSRLGEAIDQGIAAARKKWEPGADGSEDGEGAPEEEE